MSETTDFKNRLEDAVRKLSPLFPVEVREKSELMAVVNEFIRIDNEGLPPDIRINEADYDDYIIGEATGQALHMEVNPQFYKEFHSPSPFARADSKRVEDIGYRLPKYIGDFNYRIPRYTAVVLFKV